MTKDGVLLLHHRACLAEDLKLLGIPNVSCGIQFHPSGIHSALGVTNGRQATENL